MSKIDNSSKQITVTKKSTKNNVVEIDEKNISSTNKEKEGETGTKLISAPLFYKSSIVALTTLTSGLLSISSLAISVSSALIFICFSTVIALFSTYLVYSQKFHSKPGTNTSYFTWIATMATFALACAMLLLATLTGGLNAVLLPSSGSGASSWWPWLLAIPFGCIHSFWCTIGKTLESIASKENFQNRMNDEKEDEEVETSTDVSLRDSQKLILAEENGRKDKGNQSSNNTIAQTAEVGKSKTNTRLNFN